MLRVLSVRGNKRLSFHKREKPAPGLSDVVEQHEPEAEPIRPGFDASRYPELGNFLAECGEMPAIIARLSSLFESLDILVAETMGPIPPRHTPRDTLQALKLLGTCGPFGGRFSAVISLMRSSKSAHTEAGELACEALENAHSYAKCAGVLLAGARTTWEGERHVLLGSLPNYDEVDVPGEAEPTSAHALINSIGPLLLELNYTIMSIEVFWSRLQQNIFPQGRRGHLQLKQHRVEEWTEGQKMLKEYEGDCSSAMIRLKAVGEDLLVLEENVD